MSDFLSILSDEQRDLLSPEQLEQIKALNNINLTLPNVVFKFNELLQMFFNHIEFCQHDSDYRPKNNETSQKTVINIKNDMLRLIDAYPNVNNEVFLYGIKNYKLTEYYYASVDNVYAARAFRCVTIDDFCKYCKDNNLESNNYILNSHDDMMELDNEKNNFSKYMEKFRKIYTYRFPGRIEIYEKDVYNGEFPSHFMLFSKFKFIDVLKLRDYLVIVSAFK